MKKVKNLTLLDHWPRSNSTSSPDHNQLIFDLRKLQNENEQLRDKIDSQLLLGKERESVIFAMECQLKEMEKLVLNQGSDSPLYSSVLRKNIPSPKYTSLGKIKKPPQTHPSMPAPLLAPPIPSLPPLGSVSASISPALISDCPSVPLSANLDSITPSSNVVSLAALVPSPASVPNPASTPSLPLISNPPLILNSSSITNSPSIPKPLSVPTLRPLSSLVLPSASLPATQSSMTRSNPSRNVPKHTENPIPTPVSLASSVSPSASYPASQSPKPGSRQSGNVSSHFKKWSLKSANARRYSPSMVPPPSSVPNPASIPNPPPIPIPVSLTSSVSPSASGPAPQSPRPGSHQSGNVSGHFKKWSLKSANAQRYSPSVVPIPASVPSPASNSNPPSIPNPTASVPPFKKWSLKLANAQRYTPKHKIPSCQSQAQNQTFAERRSFPATYHSGNNSRVQGPIKVRIYHDSNLRWSSPKQIQKVIRDLHLGSNGQFAVTMSYTPKLEHMLDALKNDDNENGVVIIATMTNNAKDHQSVAHTHSLLQKGIHSLSHQTARKNVIFLESPPSLQFDIFHYNKMAFHLCQSEGIQFASNLLARSHIKQDGLHILGPFKHLMVESVAAAIAGREPYSLLGLRQPMRHPMSH